MENILQYYYLKIALSGMVIFALVHFLYIFINVPTKKTRATLIITFAAALYVLSDFFNDFFTITIRQEDAASILFLLEKLVPLMFLFLAPYYLGGLYTLKGRFAKINRAVFVIGVIASVLLAADVIYKMIYMNGGIIPFDNSGTMMLLGLDSMYIIKSILFIACLIYTIISILISETQKKSNFPVNNILIGLVIISYVAFYYVYIIIFTERGAEVIYNGFPHISFGITIFILFLSLAMIDVSILSNSKLAEIKNTINSSLYLDPQLEMLNRLCFKKDIQKRLDELQGNDSNIPLLFLDIDDFQNINESYGETVGNELLVMLSRRIADNFEHMGTLYRIGGDEFTFVLKGSATEKETGDLALKMISSLRNPFILSNERYMLTISIAILFAPGDGDEPDIIMSNAYSTIRNAKKKKNSYVFFNSTLLENSSRKINTVNLLRNCISNDEFVLYYQPILNREGTMVYAEALLRCTNDNPEIGGPGTFIPLIEKAGLMKDIDNMVVRKAFYDMEMKIQSRFGISINMSAEQLTDPKYDEFLFAFAKQHSIEPGRLILEITETTLVDNIVTARESLTDLKNKGFLIAIDDFGKGFSSLTYLAELPIDILKIDMAFVHAIPGDKKKEMLAKYIIDLGKSLNLTVLAEGFEEQGQVDFFMTYGCDLYQGYYFSRPVPLAELLEKYSYT